MIGDSSDCRMSEARVGEDRGCEQQSQAWHEPKRGVSGTCVGSTGVKAWFSKEKQSQTAETCSDGLVVDICWGERTRERTVTEKAERLEPDRVGAQSEVRSWFGQCLELFPGVACVVVCWEG